MMATIEITQSQTILRTPETLENRVSVTQETLIPLVLNFTL